MHEATRLIHSGMDIPLADGSPRTVAPVIQKGSTVLLPNAAALYDDDAFVTYGRQGLASHEALKSALCDLEHATGVELYPSGVAAMTGAMLAVLSAGDDILVVDTVYKPTRRFCDQVLKRLGIRTRYYDPGLTPESLLALAEQSTRLILVECPGSLSFEMQDLGAIARLARTRNILTLADNTWAAGYLFKPLDHGIDISVQALTKYVGGHSDVFMGSAAASDPVVAKHLSDGVLHLGWATSAEDAYEMLRGLRTLPTRLARHEASGLKVAQWLATQSEVQQVLHPALPGSPGHDLWRRDFAGSCGLFSVILKPATTLQVNAFLDALEIFGLGFSWGGFESLAIDCGPQLAVRAHCNAYPGPMVRLHIGLEDPDDLIQDLRRGLDTLHA